MPTKQIESAGSGDATVVVAGPCMITGIYLANINATNRACLKIHDTATAPTAGSTAVHHRCVVPAAPSGTDTAGNNQSLQLRCVNGLAYTITTQVTAAGSTGVGAGDVVGSIVYEVGV